MTDLVEIGDQTSIEKNKEEVTQAIQLNEQDAMPIIETLKYAEEELKYTINYIDQELASLENKMNASNKLSAVGYQAKASLIGHRIDAAKSLAQLAMKKRDQDFREDKGEQNSSDILELLTGSKGKRK